MDEKLTSRNTLIASSFCSLSDMCEQGLMKGLNAHCTFRVSLVEREWMRKYFVSKGGEQLSFTTIHSDTEEA